MALGLVSTMVIARLLTPDEIGTFAIASSVVMIMAEFRILGANAYLIREKELTDSKIRSAYGLTIVISWGLGLVVAALAFPLADYFRVPEVSIIFLILSVSFLFAPYISIPDALLSREYRFREITITKLAASISQLALTTVLILQGFSFYSLAIGYIVATIVQFVLNLYFTRDTRVYRPSFRGLRPIAKLGIFTSLSHVLRKTQHTLPDMVIGKLGTTAQVGMFSRGLGLVVFVSNVILSGITPVALPYLSDVKKSGEDIRAAYTKASQLVAGLIWPVLAVASVASLPAIRLLFGDQWDDAAPIASVVALWGILRSGHALSPKALLATGKETAMLLKEVIVFVVFVVAIIIGYSRFGMMGAGLGFMLTGFADFLLASLFMKTSVGLGIFRYWRALISSAMVALVCWVFTQGIAYYFPFDATPSWVTALQIVFMLPFVWLVSVFVFFHPIRKEALKLLDRFQIFKGK